LTQNMSRPIPQVRMRGTHTETTHHHHNHNSNRRESKTETIVDFDVTLDFDDLLLIEHGCPGILKAVEPEQKAYRGGRFRKRGRILNDQGLLENPILEKDVRGWAEDYCRNPSSLKEFKMEKVCPGYDTAYLQRLLEGLIRATNYSGHTHITFPTTNNLVVIRPSNRVTRLRYNKFMRWFFYLTFLWLFSWPTVWFLTAKYNVVRSIWPLATEENGHRVVKMIEDEWFIYWQAAIRRAIIAKRQGKVTQQDIIAIASEAETPRIQTGYSAADSVLGATLDFFGRVQDVSRSVQGWGADIRR